MSRHQHAAALRLLAEPGKMLGAWIKKLKANKNPDASSRPEGRAG